MSLQEVMKSSTLAEAILEALSERKRFRAVTDLRRLFIDVAKKTNGNLTQEQFNEVIHNIEKAGLGRFVAGRKNNPDRFKWADKDTAKAIKEGDYKKFGVQPEAKEPSELPAKGEESFREAIATVSSQGIVTYLNIRVPINIPLDKLQDFISTVKTLKTV